MTLMAAPSIRSILLFFLLFCSARVCSQQFHFPEEIRFVQYLQSKDLFREAQYVVDRIDTARLSMAEKDTVHYLSGWAAYNFKQLDASATQLLKVSPRFPLYKKSRFFAAYNLAYLGRQDSARQIVTELPLTDPVDREARQFELAGLALLRRDYPAYRQLQGDFTYTSYALEKQERDFVKFDSALSRFKRKSPLLAGMYSAVLPGAGKFYAGKKRQGIAAFLPILSLGAITWEAYRKGGVKSARFIGFGSLFTVFYAGNIWGSVLSVKIKQTEFYRTYDNQILFDMHIPLRSLYN